MTAAAVPAVQASVIRSPVTHRAPRPIAAGATPRATTVARAAPVRATEDSRAAWKTPVDAAQTRRGRTTAPVVRARAVVRRTVRAPRTSPPTSSRQPPRAAGVMGLDASTWAGPTVPHSTAAPSTSPAPDNGLFVRLLIAVDPRQRSEQCRP